MGTHTVDGLTVGDIRSGFSQMIRDAGPVSGLWAGRLVTAFQISSRWLGGSLAIPREEPGRIAARFLCYRHSM